MLKQAGFSAYCAKNEGGEKNEEIEDLRLTSRAPTQESAKVLFDLISENKKLREENAGLLEYKDRLEKYQSLSRIFEDEKSMEDWLERNIHRVLPDLEIIDRQPIVYWNEAFMRNRPDFFCLDKTTRELVIIENKVRGRNKRLETQYLTYTTWAQKNLEKINQKYCDKKLKATP